MISPTNHNNNTNTTDTNLLLNEANVKTYIKSETSYFTKIKKHIINSRMIKGLPKGAVGCIAGAGIGFMTIEVIHLISFILTSNEEKKSALSNVFFGDTMIFVKVLYTVVCAMLGYYIELENYNKNNRYSI